MQNQRRSRRWAATLLAVLLAVCCCPAAGYAADSPVQLTAADAVKAGENVEIRVNAAQAGITDGKLVITYDSGALTYQGVTQGAAWTEDNRLEFAANAETPGRLVLAFAGVQPAEQGDLFVLVFQAAAAGTTEVALGAGSTLSGAGPVPVSGSVTVVVEKASGGNEPGGDEPGGDEPGGDEPDRPVIPVPGDPIRPSTPPDTGTTDQPDAPGEEESDCDGGASCPSNRFTDVNGEWFHLDVDYVVSHGLMQGTSRTTFSPDLNADRAQMVTILYRMDGSPAVQGSAPFADVPAGSYYEAAVQWAVANGITNGSSADRFSPTATLTREQIAAFLFRYAEHLGRDVSARADLSQFADAGQISGYAREAVSWAVAEGIIRGAPGGVIQPKGSASRSQIAAMIHRFDAAGQA